MLMLRHTSLLYRGTSWRESSAARVEQPQFCQLVSLRYKFEKEKKKKGKSCGMYRAKECQVCIMPTSPVQWLWKEEVKFASLVPKVVITPTQMFWIKKVITCSTYFLWLEVCFSPQSLSSWAWTCQRIRLLRCQACQTCLQRLYKKENRKLSKFGSHRTHLSTWRSQLTDWLGDRRSSTRQNKRCICGWPQISFVSVSGVCISRTTALLSSLDERTALIPTPDFKKRSTWNSTFWVK